MSEQAEELPLITSGTWQLSCKNAGQMDKAWQYAAICKVPMWAGLASDPEDLWLEYHAGGLWDSLAQDPDKQQVTLAQFQQMCDAYTRAAHPTPTATPAAGEAEKGGAA